MNCLDYCLAQWVNFPDFVLWYNSNHVVIIEKDIDLEDKGYQTLDKFGLEHMVSSFKPNSQTEQILKWYFLVNYK